MDVLLGSCRWGVFRSAVHFTYSTPVDAALRYPT